MQQVPGGVVDLSVRYRRADAVASAATGTRRTTELVLLFLVVAVVLWAALVPLAPNAGAGAPAGPLTSDHV